MPTDAAIDFGPVPPLVVGVSGVMQFEGTDRDTLKREVSRFLWQFVDPEPLPGNTTIPSHPDWKPLADTPIAILTSLAPGADVLLAEIAEELDAKYQREHPNTLLWKFRVFAPMPFPLKQFKQASTFTGSRGTPADKKKATDLLDALHEKGQAFFVPLKEDHHLCDDVPEARQKDATQEQLLAAREKCLTDRLNADLKLPARYRLRYRAAGEYIAAHSHLTLILNEQVFAGEVSKDVVKVPVASELTGDDFPYGSRLILELKRQGITPELLRSEVAFTWADSGPVVHFYTPKMAKPTDPPPEGPAVGTMTLLYPVDSRTHEGDLSHADPDWQREAGEQFATVLDQLDSFNHEWAEYQKETLKKQERDRLRAEEKKRRGEEQARRRREERVRKGRPADAPDTPGPLRRLFDWIDTPKDAPRPEKTPAEKVAGELANMIRLPDAVTAAVRQATPPPPDPTDPERKTPAQKVHEYGRGLDRLARARRRASDMADGVYSEKWKKFLTLLFVLTVAAALLVHVGGHWHTPAAHKPDPEAKKAEVKKADDHPADDHPADVKVDHPHDSADHDDPAHWKPAMWVENVIKSLLVVAAVVLIVWAYVKFMLYKWSKQEEFRFDFRALAEGVRVQVYWAAAGLAQSVPANYMQRQRNEMVWIRRAITALAAPYTRWADGFAALNAAEQLAVLKSVIANWVRWDERLDPTLGDDAKKVAGAKRKAQAGYMERAAFEDHRSEHFWKRLGFDFTLIGLVLLLWWVSAQFCYTWMEWVCRSVWLTPLALVILGWFGWRWYTGWRHARVNPQEAQHDEGRPVAYLWRRKKTLGGAVWGGFAWAREMAYPYARWWEARHVGKDWPEKKRRFWFTVARGANVGVIVSCCVILTVVAAAWVGSLSSVLPVPRADTWWAIAYGTMLLAGALCIAWPERHAMAEHSRQYESMWAMFQAAGRRLVGHVGEAQAALDANDLVKFRGRVKAIQELLYHIGLQALDENAEWLILHRSRPLEPLMAG